MMTEVAISSETFDLTTNTATILVTGSFGGNLLRLEIVAPIPDGDDRSEDRMRGDARAAAKRLLEQAFPLFDTE